jgi:predicted dinucleotide-binding enzyme
MKIGILGTGVVGQTLAKKLLELGHEVKVGARSADSPSLEPLRELDGIESGSFADAAAFGELLINATNGNVSVAAIGSTETGDRAAKTLLDVGNLLEPQPAGMPRATASTDNCLAVEIQETFPELNVVKSLNTMNCSIMVEPSLVPGDHVVFVSGDDDAAKQQVKELLAEFGWREVQIVDLGGIDTATGPEMMMAIWLGVIVARGGFGAGPVNFAINSG